MNFSYIRRGVSEIFDLKDSISQQNFFIRSFCDGECQIIAQMGYFYVSTFDGSSSFFLLFRKFNESTINFGKYIKCKRR